jgi:hypothetical protein
VIWVAVPGARVSLEMILAPGLGVIGVLALLSSIAMIFNPIFTFVMGFVDRTAG